MKSTIIIATTNKGKLAEFKSLLNDYEVLSNTDIGFNIEIEETGSTLEENALIKAETIFQFANKNVMAEDSGLFIEALNNEPGVWSARYAGEPSNAVNNISHVLEKLKDSNNRKACFKTVICYKEKDHHHFFEGRIDGTIIHEMKGSSGFGYDPIFMPDDYNHTFAELDLAVKNKISHRAIAIRKFLDFLKNNG